MYGLYISAMRRISILIFVGSLIVAACSSADAKPSTSDARRSPGAAEPVGVSALDTVVVMTEQGLAGVDRLTHRVRWRGSGAVVAADGSAVFADDYEHVARLHLSTGETAARWPADVGLRLALVAPGGRWVARTDMTAEYSSEDHTQLEIYDGQTGAVLHDLTLDGRVEPVAFSPDGSILYSLTHRTGTFRMQAISLATGEQVATIDENKKPSGVMRGERIKGVLSTDRAILATLYRNPENAVEPAFVQVLVLDEKATYRVGLPGPFGAGTDVIERTDDDLIIVLAEAGKRASFSLRELVSGGESQLDLSITDGPRTRADAQFQDIPGFVTLVTELG